ncbi:hypothetical protein [Bradyrhizobium sp. SZCCHNPS1003]|uniref:hypothetical protein n=1 Tax=Bradyrhizobium sp. SZCCHNPS1003 TaxID=3057330 RepID=UPI0028EEFAB1|nr:hypothetical protein [Bradyrhizobium sp. SZCCHNPS1003]
MSAVERLKDRIIDMIEKGCTGFSWSTGSRWHELPIEEKAAAILDMWDAPKDSGAPASSGKPPVDVRDYVAEVMKEAREEADKKLSVQKRVFGGM